MTQHANLRRHEGWVKEMRIEASGQLAALISCPSQAIPPPGCYLLASSDDAVLASPLFLGAKSEGGFLAAAPVEISWEPGMQLHLRGPHGKGFSLPADTRRLALAGLGNTITRLLPLAELAINQNAAVSLFSDASFPSLPSAIEASLLAALPEALAWADFLVLDLALEDLPFLRDRLGLARQAPVRCPGQALVLAPMPCAGLAECGVCALRTRKGWKLACRDGPVFRLDELLED